ncbi:hypothetical protein P389DRAFT_74223 [Cystobasidium minutum MCA 4210]|uniref:uncharacterized protein n=1 Tax=Cystobasidium minutum MCA 4210 TaxID=1397322 RepID=UPI0034CF1CD1|eukprot:jgi/Rhomi1/74223/CE74222_923
MVRSFSFGDWNEICRNVPSMPVCSLFLKQQLTLLSPSQYRSALALPDRSVEPEAFDIALSSAGLGVRAVCALPRMGSTGGYPGSAGNAPNIVACIFAIILGIVLASLASKRAAAVARWEIRTFFIVFSLQYLFQLLSTGSFIRQGSAGIVWVTAIQLGLVLVLFWTLAWAVFLQVQLIEDGTRASIIPYSIMSILLFIGFTYICLDTGFSISGYFDTTPQTLHNTALYVFLFIFCGLFVLFSVVVGAWVSGMFLRERRPLFLYSASFLFFILSQAAMWALSQAVCRSSTSTIDGSFISTLCSIISVIFFYYAWKSVTEDTWDEVQTSSEYGGRIDSSRYSQGPLLGGVGHGTTTGYGSQSGYGTATSASQVPSSGPYMQETSTLQSNYPYHDHRT